MPTTSDINTTLAHLGQHPGWEALRDVARERMEVHFRTLVNEFATKDRQLDYAELQWYRGFFAGMKSLLDNPTLEAKKLEKQLADERKERER